MFIWPPFGGNSFLYSFYGYLKEWTGAYSTFVGEIQLCRESSELLLRCGGAFARNVDSGHHDLRRFRLQKKRKGRIHGQFDFIALLEFNLLLIYVVMKPFAEFSRGYNILCPQRTGKLLA